MEKPPIILWIRRELRLHDNPALAAAAASGRPVIPLVIRDDAQRALGAAPMWRLGLGLEYLSARLDALGSRLILRSGPPGKVLAEVLAQTGAQTVFWSRGYGPETIAQDTRLRADLVARGIEVRSFNAHLLFEPWTVATRTGGFYKVYTPFWNAVKTRDVPALLPAVTALPTPAAWPQSETLGAWQMARGMNRGADVVRRHLWIGEEKAAARLGQFLDTRIDAYDGARDFLARDATSGLSENLSVGEISARTLWHAGLAARERGAGGAERFLKELVWREFAYHLMFHTPHILTENWRLDWQDFQWRADNDDAEKWRRGLTGVALVDAAMRELYVTGRMHNRGRMIAASFLTKHLGTDWQVGRDWFQDCLVDWDPASNAMGWQWVAGCGPDASPYFRIFNPDLQAAKFDPDGTYRQRWLGAGKAGNGDTTPGAAAFFEAAPRHWNLPATPRPDKPIVALDAGRKRALSAYAAWKG